MKEDEQFFKDVNENKIYDIVCSWIVGLCVSWVQRVLWQSCEKIFIFFATSFFGMKQGFMQFPPHGLKHQLQINVESEMWMAMSRDEVQVWKHMDFKASWPCWQLRACVRYLLHVTSCITCCVLLIFKIRLNIICIYIFFYRICAPTDAQRWTTVADFGLQCCLDNNKGQHNGFYSLMMT